MSQLGKAEYQPLAGSEAINFTQHLMPDGRLNEIFIDRPSEVDRNIWSQAYVTAEKIRGAGYSFHAEMLSDYSTISLTSVGFHVEMGEENDICMILAPNGPDIPHKVVELINKTVEKLVEWGVLTDAS